jgi:hypothetical protein
MLYLYIAPFFAKVPPAPGMRLHPARNRNYIQVDESKKEINSKNNIKNTGCRNLAR